NLQSQFQTFNTGNMYIQEMGEDVKANGEYNIFALRHRGDSHGDQWVTEIDGLRAGTAETAVSAGSLIWGKVVEEDFRVEVRKVAKNLGFDPTWLMAVMAFETGNTFKPTTRNTQSTATGLIQFLESTARALGTTTAKLARMTAVEQLEYVQKYYEQSHLAGRVRNLYDAYMAVLWPAGIGKSSNYVLWYAGSREYADNIGLDTTNKGYITKGDCNVRMDDKVLRGQQYAR
ncbi:MAG: hypothetical protein ACRC8E_08880, partial [Plesiomonas shigelloides]